MYFYLASDLEILPGISQVFSHSSQYFCFEITLAATTQLQHSHQKFQTKYRLFQILALYSLALLVRRKWRNAMAFNEKRIQFCNNAKGELLPNK